MKCRISAMQAISHQNNIDFYHGNFVSSSHQFKGFALQCQRFFCCRKSPSCYTRLFEAQFPLGVVQFGTVMRKRKSVGGADSKPGKLGRIAEALCPVIGTVTEWSPGCIDDLRAKYIDEIWMLG